jgi:hypothetical protein
MKTAKTIFAGNIATSGLALADDGVIEKEPVTPGSYCHAKFRAIDPSTLDSDNPTVQGSTSGDVVDFYGPCDETSTGKIKSGSKNWIGFSSKLSIEVKHKGQANRLLL